MKPRRQSMCGQSHNIYVGRQEGRAGRTKGRAQGQQWNSLSGKEHLHQRANLPLCWPYRASQADLHSWLTLHFHSQLKNWRVLVIPAKTWLFTAHAWLTGDAQTWAPPTCPKTTPAQTRDGVPQLVPVFDARVWGCTQQPSWEVEGGSRKAQLAALGASSRK